MYTVASYLAYVAAAVVISAFLFAACLIVMLLDTGIRSLTFATRQAVRQAVRFIAGRAVQPALHRAADRLLLTGRGVIRLVQRAAQLVAEKPMMRSLPHPSATEHPH